jgi:two-component system CheB/CheR fusion protein
LLELSLKAEGHRTATASNGNAAVMLVTQGAIQPDLVLLDYNLPDGPNGLEVADALRKTLHRDVPAIVLTGDITTETMHDIAAKNVTRLNKPVQLKELAETIQRLLPAHAAGVPPQRAVPAAHPPAHPAASPGSDAPVIYIVDDDPEICDTLRLMFEDDGCVVETYLTGEAFFAAYQPGREACLLIDAYLPGMSGFDVLKRLAEARPRLPSIMITGNSDVSMAVEAMKAGAVDFIEKPIGRTELLAVVERALERARDGRKLDEWRDIAAKHIAGLTPRQYEIMTMMLAGHPSKNIAADLNISQRTVENHRAAIMKKTGSKSLPALARLAIAASAAGTQERAAA